MTHQNPSRASWASCLDEALSIGARQLGYNAARIPMVTQPPWRCAKCGREFANRNQSHACATHDLDHHFRGKPPEIRALFDRIVQTISAVGPVRVLAEKTRIAFQVRMTFAQVTTRRHWIDGHVVLARRLEHPRFRLVQTFSPRNHVHVFRIRSESEVDAEFAGWVREAYAVGEQRHLDVNKTRIARKLVPRTKKGR